MNLRTETEIMKVFSSVLWLLLQRKQQAFLSLAAAPKHARVLKLSSSVDVVVNRCVVHLYNLYLYNNTIGVGRDANFSSPVQSSDLTFEAFLYEHIM